MRAIFGHSFKSCDTWIVTVNQPSAREHNEMTYILQGKLSKGEKMGVYN